MKIILDFENKPLIFSRPEKIIRCFRYCGLAPAFEEIESALKKGLYVAGFLSYEAGYAFEERLCAHAESEFPLLHMGCYQKPSRIKAYPQDNSDFFSIRDLQLNITKKAYDENIQKIRDHIALGDVYQITYCIKNIFSFAGSALRLYRQLLKAQPVPYPAYIETDSYTILSLSPELFIKKRGNFILTKPMKGTWGRGQNFFADLFSGLQLKYDAKNRAENVMIADLLRNDLGRVGKNIRTPKLFKVKRYATLYQMTSTVTSHIDRDIPLYNLFKAVFPSGSVTGAPKIRAMEIIRQLELEERKIYTGAIGYITPDKDLFFNVPIRTLLLKNGRGEMGVGGGIVWDSTSDGEWSEGILKAKFLTDLAV